ncbi:predicted protein [Naegleria gruberi]|nr:uncharacterized protein NAEGRDRAFT_76553 [Naegleria gruberi]EFC35790.1 predicted protein [Naegleria gruberi]|eukprot:XP_002668534.1 predicted protein [Naegleria gruberi strain NEG-M]
MPDFTTTTETDRMIGAVVLMAAMKNYFDYMFSLCCNLPNVTLLGEVEDWVSIRERANRLLEFDTKENCMKKWSKLLFPVLDKFVESIKGNPDKEWWNRVAHHCGGGSGPSYLSGWITSFCVFSDKGHWVGDQKSVNIWGETTTMEWPIIDQDVIPRGYVSVPIVVDDNGTIYDTEMFAGHMSTELLEDGKTLKPRADWALFVAKKI